MNRYLLYTCLTAILFSACGKTDSPAVELPDGTMRFLATVTDKVDDWGDKRASRGVVANSATITEFGAYCFQTGRALWADVATTALPNKMFDIPVSRSGNDWSYNPPVKWEGGDGSYFTFFGYSPRATGLYLEPSNSLGNNLELLKTDADGGIPTLQYSTLNDVTSQVDLLFAAPIYNTYPVDRVKMQFAHALSQIRFKAWSNKVGVTPSAIAIKGVKYKGTIEMDGKNIAWAAASDVSTFALQGNFPPVSTDQTKMTDLSSGNRAFMLLPQDLTANATATIEISVNLAGVETVKSYTIKENWQAGKSYTYNLQLGGDPTEEVVVTSVTITDWMVDGEDDMTTTPPDEPTSTTPINPPKTNQIVRAGNLDWTTGNLVAKNNRECMVGEPHDGGVYFQFGSLIGWKGGAAENGGTGVGVNTNYDNSFWDGSSAVAGGVWTFEGEAYVWPQAMDANRPPEYVEEVYDGSNLDESTAHEYWHFNFKGISAIGTIDYDANGNSLRDYEHPTLGKLSEGKMDGLGIGDPCTYYLGNPWRLPTGVEYEALLGPNGVWSAETDATYETTPYKRMNYSNNTLFFPVSGCRQNTNRGSFYYTKRGQCWASTIKTHGASYMEFTDSNIFPNNSYGRSFARPVRCVRTPK